MLINPLSSIECSAVIFTPYEDTEPDDPSKVPPSAAPTIDPSNLAERSVLINKDDC